MRELKIKDALRLVASTSKPSISIYLKTDLQEPDGAARIRANLQRLFRKVESLITKSYDRQTKERLLGPLKRSIDSLKLTRARGGIAIYHSEDFTGLVKLPTSTKDLAVAAESYHVKPVLRCMQMRRNYFLLALRKRHSDFYLVTPEGTQLIERNPLFSRTEKSFGGSEDSKLLFRNSLKIRKLKDVRAAMEALNRRLECQWFGERIPLLIAGTNQYQNVYRESCMYGHLLDKGLSGHIDSLDKESLVGMANRFMEHHYAEVDNQAVVNFRKAQVTGLTSTDLREISEAAAKGQIQSLLVAEDRHLWGHLDRASGLVYLLDQKTDASSDDVLDDIAELTLLKGGAVTVLPSVQMPNGSEIAAVFRWAPSEGSINASLTKPIYRPQLKSMNASEIRA